MSGLGPASGPGRYYLPFRPVPGLREAIERAKGRIPCPCGRTRHPDKDCAFCGRAAPAAKEEPADGQ